DSFQIEDRIITFYEAPEPVSAVFAQFAPYIKAETLSRELRPGAGPTEAYAEVVSLDGHQVKLAVSR
ncbi:MAG TPA: DUF5915 domain-containing protein, partial [Chloroflexota bacterium]